MHNDLMPPRTIFLTRITSPAEKAGASLLIESIQSFGGSMSKYPIWIFTSDPQIEFYQDIVSPQVEIFPITIPEPLKNFPFASKVMACAQAEEMASSRGQTLVWFDLECLVIQPPLLFELGDQFDAAFRPVHHRNVGLSPAEPLDAFWRGIYHELGIQDVSLTVESFIGRQPLRAYFNSHAFSLNPALGLFKRWADHFQHLAMDTQFQQTACPDEKHRIFLFQALLSALAASSLDSGRIRILPDIYNYPYNLHGQVPDGQRPKALNDLVTITFEGRNLHPDAMTDLEIHDPLRTWLREKIEKLK